MGHRYSGEIVNTDELTLLSPSHSGLSILISECKKYVTEYDTLFNGNKSNTLCFKGRLCKPMRLALRLLDNYINISKTVMNLGHTIYSENKNEGVKY